jgi:hypothetical protein
VVLTAIPFVSHYERVITLLGFQPWFLAAVFFGSLFLAVANLIYDAVCPTIVKRFASPNDLYKEMLCIGQMSRTLYSTDSFDASLDPCKTAYTNASNEHPNWRFICRTLYVAASVLFAIVFAYRSWLVLTLFVHSQYPESV